MTHRSKVDIDIHRGYNRDDNVTSQGFTKYYISKGVNVFITIENRADLNNYRLIKHSLERGYSIDTIKNGEYLALFKPPPSKKTTVTVFYSISDITHENPLLVQFGEGYNGYYTTTDSTNWSKQNGINESNIKKTLEKLNCQKNQYHVIKISEGIGYSCPSCSTQPVLVSPGSSYYTHTVYGYIGELRDGDIEQRGVTLTGRISSVYVYWSKWETPKPLLINIQGSTWYQRTDLVSSKWTPVSQHIPRNFSDKTNILRILIGYYSPTVTIDIGDGKGLSESGSGTTYKDPGSQDNQETISLRRDDVKVDKKGTEYIGFTHFVSSKPAFIAREIKHNSNTLEDVKPNYPLDSVTAFYFGDEPSEEKKLLLVELKKFDKTYKYYERAKKDAPIWTELIRGGEENRQLYGPSLKEELEKLKKIAGYSTAGGLATAETVNFALDTGWSIFRRVTAIFTAAI
ncbi:hypothetical protein BEWA_047660 [Theileria equi strain WA]|uniref:Uncharacterized protein n=1 Tax=Theileria equi strain WA TaxID=1537102 RepID=L1LAG7_THEEQ|nr:hypothetical protein BEWA_047660 [Theileria equi strain WA]EKX72301.1 hypothetical protein BEWA_047660 [Theileria equi strain WA]|eukprot:XP_004831753.1 hypothetical protein BEWA_047660 [Theileria equi strain WA]